VTTTHVSGGSLAALPNNADGDMPPLRHDYEYRALAALCRLARDRELAPRAALGLLVEERVASSVTSLHFARLHADDLTRRFAFNTSPRKANDADRAVLRTQLARAHVRTVR
jgi:hypothetical protein